MRTRSFSSSATCAVFLALASVLPQSIRPMQPHLAPSKRKGNPRIADPKCSSFFRESVEQSQRSSGGAQKRLQTKKIRHECSPGRLLSPPMLRKGSTTPFCFGRAIALQRLIRSLARSKEAGQENHGRSDGLTPRRKTSSQQAFESVHLTGNERSNDRAAQ